MRCNFAITYYINFSETNMTGLTKTEEKKPIDSHDYSEPYQNGMNEYNRYGRHGMYCCYQPTAPSDEELSGYCSVLAWHNRC